MLKLDNKGREVYYCPRGRRDFREPWRRAPYQVDGREPSVRLQKSSWERPPPPPPHQASLGVKMCQASGSPDNPRTYKNWGVRCLA
ncbi:hypothetical protein J6590_035350 [Homalodisca vitripennis]|nr:hypothetical protein J6590_035350 [Homalodisca vitripennis]